MKYFAKSFFDFFHELTLNNNREWFGANKKRYECEVREQLLRFIEALGERFPEISPHLRAEPKSLMRIHRDIRFSKDKRPYKTNAGLHFWLGSAGHDIHAPGFYLHLSAEANYAGGGMWHPDPAAIAKIRAHILARPKEWRKVRKSITLEGEALKRPPQGFDAQHEFIEDLKHKDFVTSVPFTEKQVCGANFLDIYLAACSQMAPLMAFLAGAVKVDW